YVDAVHLDGSALAGFPATPETIPGWFGPLSIGDIDGDGKPDIATVFNDDTGPGDQPRNLRLYVFDAHGQTKNGYPRAVGTRPPWGLPRNDTAPLLAALNGDGVLAVAVGRNRHLKIDARTGTGGKVLAKFKLPRFNKDPWDVLEPLVAADLNGD